MSIVDTLSEQFSPEVREEGREDFDKDRVTIDRASRGRVRATVRDTDPSGDIYTQFILNDGELLDRRCTCTAFAEHGQCRHLYAAVLQANADGLMEEEAFVLVPAGDGRAMRYKAPAPGQASEPIAPRQPAWKRQFEDLKGQLDRPRATEKPTWPEDSQLVYFLDISQRLISGGLTVSLGRRKLNKTGGWREPQPNRFRDGEVALAPDAEDKLIVQMLGGSHPQNSLAYMGYGEPAQISFELNASSAELLLPRLCETDRLFTLDRDLQTSAAPISYDDQQPWELWLEFITDTEEAERYKLALSLRREERQLPIDAAQLLTDQGWAVIDGRVSRFEHFGAFPIAEFFDENPPVSFAVEQIDDVIVELMKMAPLPRLHFPAELNITTRQSRMQPHLVISAAKAARGDNRLNAKLVFEYAGTKLDEEGPAPEFDGEKRELIVRDPIAEQSAAETLTRLGAKSGVPYQQTPRYLPAARLAAIVTELVREGWLVEAEGKIHRQPSDFNLDVSSGIDWFELRGDIDFGGHKTTLPALLAALRKGERVVQLDDGSVGMLPDDWIAKYGLLARLAQPDEGVVKFSLKQVGLLDALLSSVPNTVDETFAAARREMLSFDSIQALDKPEGFQGELRNYQREGLGWLKFLERFGFGGCLADDMGLGKTVQVLSMLLARKGNSRPSLVVVPRSLVFNWMEEAKRFAPQLRLLDHTGPGRQRGTQHFAEYDVIVATYGTMRLDAPLLKDFDFDYAVLDEAQSIKNASSESAKACRLLRADHRLALTGTPIQNHLGELWSLFEFLNPGMLGAASIFRFTGGNAPVDKETRQLMARALRPFILRRTKEQVAKDLPEKTEQTLWCDLDAGQRRLYDELRDHYRTALLGQPDLNKSKMQILEALLRLRQAACHPGLIDKTRSGEGSAKLEALLPQLSELMEEGHKVLVFSQFTSLLAIVRQHLDAQKITYEYLDGKTKDRQARVDRFQTDPDCKLFLISLKAGGLGLNLTAAEYVFLLDPWWNPAIEAQAIDRAHRIGQTRQVFAYRIIARDTVEQKVLELQSRKKDLADMILTADNSLIGKLDRDDLQLLLS